MSKLFKSKVLAGVVIVMALVVVGAAVSATTANAQVSCSIMSTLRQGSAGADVACLQSKLGITADGAFGPMTKAAVVAFQAANGLAADGVVGPMTISALGGGMVSGLPAGCASASGYSATTGQPCVGGSVGTLPAGCTSTVGYSSTTGQACSGVSTLPAGCTSTAGFSVTTGAPCSGGTSTPTGPLQGGAGSLEDADLVSSVNNEEVGENQSDVQVLGMDLEADSGSDLAFTAVKVEFEDQNATGSEDLDDFAEEVSIWLGSTKVGSAEVDDFSETSGVWSETINLSNAVVRAGDSENLYIAVTALSNIDSSDMTDNDWRVGIVNIRYMDAQGAVITDNSTGDIGSDLAAGTTNTRAFDFTDFVTAADVELTVSEANDNPEAGTVEVDEDGGDEVVLLVGEFEAEGSDIDLSELRVTVTPAGTGDASDIASEYILRIDGDDMQSVDSDDCTTGTCDGSGAAVVYTFDDFDFTVEEGDTVEFEIVAVLNEISLTFVGGDSLTASVVANATNIEAEADGEDLSDSELTGSANGEAQSFYAEGVTASNFSSSVTTLTDSGATTKQVYTISFDVTAFGNTYYLPKATERGELDGDDTSGLSYLVETSAGATATTENVASAASSLSSSNATTVSNYFRVSEGQTRSFSFTVELTPGNAAAFYRVQLNDLLYDLDQTAEGDNEGIYDFSPAQNFETQDRSLPTSA